MKGLSLPRKTNKESALNDLLPKELDLFDIAKVHLVKQEDFFESKIHLDEEKLIKTFSILFSISGEYSGISLANIHQESYKDLDQEAKELIIEVSNIISGNFLGSLEKSLCLLSHLHPPVVHDPSKDCFAKSQRRLKKSVELSQDSSFIKGTYCILFKEVSYYLDIVFSGNLNLDTISE